MTYFRQLAPNEAAKKELSKQEVQEPHKKTAVKTTQNKQQEITAAQARIRHGQYCQITR
jgi:hypothetical protein